MMVSRTRWFSVNSTYQSEHTINGGDVNGGLSSLIRVIAADDPKNTTGKDFVELVEMERDQAHAEDGGRVCGVERPAVEPHPDLQRDGGRR